MTYKYAPIMLLDTSKLLSGKTTTFTEIIEHQFEQIANYCKDLNEEPFTKIQKTDASLYRLIGLLAVAREAGGNNVTGIDTDQLVASINTYRNLWRDLAIELNKFFDNNGAISSTTDYDPIDAYSLGYAAGKLSAFEPERENLFFESLIQIQSEQAGLNSRKRNQKLIEEYVGKLAREVLMEDTKKVWNVSKVAQKVHGQLEEIHGKEKVDIVLRGQCGIVNADKNFRTFKKYIRTQLTEPKYAYLFPKRGRPKKN
ncbi:hypothetical protein DRW07_02135 [Alteromonas sediminis]|uniref:Uncharacterized protein n=1 Tax=Alteromonas sediminis TaxID=2259342 RepID=A0A3N5Y9Z9_9ALTE|nr:hypothetical protein [Alteromonas sediminis]RPJ68229.1 hypothetical protein DRW07_02135 [Alteromonas sediminis]